VARPDTVTYLFSDIEGSTRLWESDPDGAARAIAWHDDVSRNAVQHHRGTVVKMTGDGMHAAFDDPAAATAAAFELQTQLASPQPGMPMLKVRCGLHLGVDQRRDNDYFGAAVNRAARIMNAAHGGQVLLSQAVADHVARGLPDGASLRELGQVRLRDLSSPERVYQLVHPALRSEFPALRSLASTPNNLPQQLNSFIGREREMAEVRALLAANRLVTLLAMGGVGKSRLSIQLGADVLDDFPDGVWLVELAPISDGSDVARATAAVLGVKEEAGGGALEALAAFVRDRALLLILDNCEQVVRGAAAMTKRLLQAGASLKVLATTRDPLQIAGESVYHLATLSVPADRESRPEQLARHASVQLFLDRATAAQPAFRLTETVAGPVGEICRRLDGIPLALELAAARARSIPVATIAARLDQRFKLLTTPDQTVLPRQRTLRALIDWSHDLLDERERTVFRRLAVFAGGWTLEAAESIAAGEVVRDVDVVDVLSSLVEKSLVTMEADSGRYRMLDTVRHYADERLGDSGERDIIRARHLSFFAELAEQARPHLTGRSQATWLVRLDADRDNLLAAHEEGCSSDRHLAAALKIARGTRFYWFNRGQPSKGLQFYLDLLQCGEAVLGERDRCRVLFGAGQFCYHLGRHAEARRYLAECLALAERTGDEVVLAAVLQPLGLTCLESGDLASARAYLEAALERARAGTNQREVLASLTALAMMNILEGDIERGAPEVEEALGIARATGDDESTARCLINGAVLDLRAGRKDRARERLREAVDIARRQNSHSLLQYVLDGCLALAAAGEDWPAAAACYRLSERLLQQMGRRRERFDNAVLESALQAVRARPGEGDAGSGDAGDVSVQEILSAARTALHA
jgi:predicted ATPase/class 3 adenylate cyclase/Tfp pilus assembly protein PilF